MLHYRVGSLSTDLRLSLDITHRLCEVIDTPRSLAVSLMLQYEEWAEYMDLTIDPGNYEEPGNFARDYLVTEILRKNPDIPLGVDRVKVAVDSFKESEAQCKRTNDKLKGAVPDWFHTVRKRLLSVIGHLTSEDVLFVERSFKFGPGASTGVRGLGSVLSDKYDKPLHLTTGLIPYFRSILGDTWWEHHRHSVHEVVPGNKFTTVPKSAKTDRGICIEPTLNMYVQLGIGALIRSKLRRVGIDLDDQNRNRDLARRAYTERLCTIDLSAASDSVSSGLVLQLLPERWVELLHLCRSDFCNLFGETIELEKWSSMGNGYTFELESLIFYSVCAAFVPLDDMHLVSVYGDDIIVPQAYAQSVIDALNFLGFSVNQSKSFLAGNFFESCGHDFFKGYNVRPFYLKGRNGAIPYALQIANKLRAYAHRLNCEESCDNTFRDIWRYVAGLSPAPWKLPVPLELIDQGLVVSDDEFFGRKALGGVEGWAVKHVSFSPLKKQKGTLGVLLAGLAQIESMPDRTFTLHKDLRIRADVDDARCMFSYGREPRRGLFGKIRTRVSIVVQWTRGLSWQDPLLPRGR